MLTFNFSELILGLFFNARHLRLKGLDKSLGISMRVLGLKFKHVASLLNKDLDLLFSDALVSIDLISMAIDFLVRLDKRTLDLLNLNAH